jgi:hypothetical protein|tara:strand:- start:737 stop:1795 length:1059 start_codon:yes stop_codon:yes gene_type:complete
MTKLVFNIRPASSSQIRTLSSHCRDRRPDGYSAIDLSRSDLNQRLYGEDTVSNSLDSWYDRTGAKKPAKQSETPYITVVMSAGPELFIDDDTTSAFSDCCLNWLKAQFGDDLVYVELHLDETTPHLHAVIAPTYSKKKRMPGRKRKNETDEQFQARKAAVAAAPGIRTVGRSSSKWSYADSFDDLRKSAVEALSEFGVSYGDVRRLGVRGQATRDWVKETAVKLAKRVNIFKKKWAALVKREEQVAAKIEAVKVDMSEIRQHREKLKEDTATIYQLQMQSRSIHQRLTDIARALKKSLPAESLKSPAAGGRMQRLYDDLKSVLKDEDSALRSINKKADDIFEETPDVGGPRL